MFVYIILLKKIRQTLKINVKYYELWIMKFYNICIIYSGVWRCNQILWKILRNDEVKCVWLYTWSHFFIKSCIILKLKSIVFVPTNLCSTQKKKAQLHFKAKSCMANEGENFGFRQKSLPPGQTIRWGWHGQWQW